MQCTLDYVLGYLKRSSIIRRIKEDPSRWGFRWDSDGIWGSGMDPKAEGAITLLLFRNIGKDHLTSILKKNHTLILSKTYLGRYTRIFWCHLVVYALCCILLAVMSSNPHLQQQQILTQLLTRTPTHTIQTWNLNIDLHARPVPRSSYSVLVFAL